MKTALITGASGGIGYEIAKLFAKDGKDLVLVARSENKLNEIKNKFEEKYGVSVYIFPKDLSKENSAKELFGEVSASGIEVDYLINNAGFGDNGPFLESDLEKQDNMIKLNVLALTDLCHLFGNEMRKRKSGKILNVSSMAAFCAGPLMSVYFATKAYVLSFTEALAEELKNDGITVTCLCPGPTETNFANAADSGDSVMFKALPVTTAEYVAKYGYKAMNKGKVRAYCGISVKALSFAVRLSPRGLNAKTATIFNRRS